jgi:mannose-6-phosphate isomerase-like protein (cupin superfamily)
MIKIIQSPAIIEAAGNIPKKIEEYFGRVNSDSGEISIARMQSPAGWKEPGQTPEFDEYTVVLSGTLKVETNKDLFYIHAGQAILVGKDEWVSYSSPETGGAQYIAVCLPAFSPETVNRDIQNQ